MERSLDEDSEYIGISNWFLRRIEDKDTHGTVVCGKTGYTSEAGFCAASYQESDDGGHYICVTADAPGTWQCIYDHVELYDMLSSMRLIRNSWQAEDLQEPMNR